MSKEIGIEYIPKDKWRDGRYILAIDVLHLMDSMSGDDRKRLAVWACEDGVLIEAVCRAVASSPENVPLTTGADHDVWFTAEAVGRLRLALAPLLGDAVAVELRAAQEKATKYERAYGLLQGLAHIRQMQREAKTFEDRRMRGEQWEQDWYKVDAMFPEYAPKKPAAVCGA